MDSHKEAVVAKGMTNVFTGLGILLGAGRISSSTHEQILALINTNEGSVTYPQPGKETPVSMKSHDLPIDMEHLKLADRPPRGPGRSSESITPNFTGDSKWPNAGINSQNSGTSGSGRGTRVICPWFLTSGYRCREHEKGRCAWVHEDVEGVRDPLICSFWAGDQSCNKSDDDCRFAHYWASHRQIAPAPNSKNKKAHKKQHIQQEPW